MSLVNDFLNTYKKLETVLRNSSEQYKVIDYEHLLPEDRERKLRLCRNIRNYLQHEYNGEQFVSPTQAMIDFMNQEMEIIKGKPIERREIVNIVEPISSDLSLSEVAKVLSSGNRIWYPVVDKYNRPRGFVDYDVYEYYVQVQRKPLSSRLKDILPAKITIPVVKTDKYKGYERAILISEDGSYRGILEN